LLRDARHAKHDIFLLRISAILPEAISDEAASLCHSRNPAA